MQTVTTNSSAHPLLDLVASQSKPYTRVPTDRPVGRMRSALVNLSYDFREACAVGRMLAEYLAVSSTAAAGSAAVGNASFEAVHKTSGNFTLALVAGAASALATAGTAGVALCVATAAPIHDRAAKKFGEIELQRSIFNKPLNHS